ncbi:MAG: zinc-ribbon domain-containing protein [Pseudomonadota bacterium]
MRLICPNCGAQYEVPADVMPPEGRDVQCSSCGQTWFQEHPDAEGAFAKDELSALEDEEVVATAPPPPKPSAPVLEKTELNTEPDQTADEPEAHDEKQELVVEASAQSDTDSGIAKDHDVPDTAAPRALDPAVADVLRAEAELESEARKKELASFESQPELGLIDASGDAERRARQSREIMARMRGETATAEDTAEPDTTVTGSRRDLLPDIEEINSTLRSNSDRSATADPGQTAQIEVQEKRSSRRGFTIAVALVAVLALVYVFADAIAQNVPQAQDGLTAYVAMIDTWRAWVDTQVSSLLNWLDQAALSSSA